jgi:hypothetical protein
MRQWLSVPVFFLSLVGIAHATDYTIAMNGTTAAQDSALQRMYLDSCNDRVRATPPQSPLGGCSSSGTPPTCVCAPSQAQLEGALGVFLKNQLTNRYQAQLDAEGKIVGQQYPSLSPSNQEAIRAACPSCTF